jgi:ATP-dependent Lon protease
MVTMIFSYNNPKNINPILLDRITSIETKYLLLNQKIHIAKNYLLPNILKELELNSKNIIFNDDIIKYIISNYTHDGGVRKLKSLLYTIVRQLNVLNLTNKTLNNQLVKYPYKLNIEDIKYILKDNYIYEIEKIHTKNKVGVVNGLYAGSYGIGGILPIQALWIPSTVPLSLKTTGYLEKVIKESTDVACTLAWNYLPKYLKKKYLKEWKNKPMGFHIHCNDGSVPKDGPSAGAALTLILYSLLINKPIKYYVAITGEINLNGEIKSIGGLEEKLEGAKLSGVELALVPKENEQNIIKIKERNPLLIDKNFEVIFIETFEQVIKYALVK